MRDRTLLERSAFVQMMVLPFIGIYWGILVYVRGTPEFHSIFDLEVVAITERAVKTFGLVWSVLFAVTVWLHKTSKSSEVIPHLTVQLYAISNVAAAYLLGTVTTPFLVVLLGSGLCALLIFPPRVAWKAVVSATTGLVGLEVLRIAGVIPYAPLVLSSPHDNPEFAHFWTGLMWFLTGSVSALMLGLFHVLLRELRERESRLHSLTRTDALTELANRRHFIEVLTKEHARASRHGYPLSCVMIDLDHFKAINDQYGHATGDEVLRQTAERLSSALRETDLVARYGGEEFVALLPDTHQEGAEMVAERCRELLAGSPMEMTDGQTISVTASFGVAVLTTKKTPGVDELLRAADDALYEAKGSGRNRVSISGLGSGAHRRHG